MNAKAILQRRNKHELLCLGYRYEVIEYNERTRERTKRFQSYGDNFSTKRAGMPDLSGFRSNKK